MENKFGKIGKKIRKNKILQILKHVGEEALTSDDLKFGQSCFGAFF
jgi:hypothetical protein